MKKEEEKSHAHFLIYFLGKPFWYKQNVFHFKYNTLATGHLDRATSKMAYVSTVIVLHKQRHQH